MNVSRLVSFVAAVILSAIQWAPFFSPALQMHSVRAVGASVAADASDASVPVVVVTAQSLS
jgi:hypothetical protein